MQGYLFFIFRSLRACVLPVAHGKASNCVAQLTLMTADSFHFHLVIHSRFLGNTLTYPTFRLALVASFLLFKPQRFELD